MTRRPQILQISNFMVIELKLTFKIQKIDFAQKRLFKDIEGLRRATLLTAFNFRKQK